MKLINFLQIMLTQSMFVALAALVSADDAEENQKTDPPMLKDKPEKKVNWRKYALVPAYIMATAILLALIPWSVWRIIRNWGSWKIHTQSPRPQYIRTSLGWIDQETWKMKKAKQSKRMEAKRDQHMIYRTTKANYKWIFHDPTGDLQQRFNDHKERSHLRFLPSWMRSYPHGTLQSGVLGQQSKAPKRVYQLPNLQLTGNGFLSSSNHLGNLQRDGSSMSGPLPNSYQLPHLSRTKYHDAVTPSIPGKLFLLSKIPLIDAPDVIQVWLIRGHERTDQPRLETEEELRGEVESPEEVVRRETDRVLVRSQEITNQLSPEAAMPEYMPFAWPPPQSPGLEPVNQDVRRQAYTEALESRILEIDRRMQQVPIDRTWILLRDTLYNLMRELEQATGVQRLEDSPIPQDVRYAIRLQQYIVNLESRIHDLQTEPTDSPVRGTLNNLMDELRGARLTWDRLPPIAGMPPPIPTTRGQLQNYQIDGFATATPNRYMAAETTVQAPDPRVVINSMNALIHLANDDSQTRLRNEWTPSGALNVDAPITTTDEFNDMLREYTTTWVNASTGEANRVMTEDPGTEYTSWPSPIYEEGSDEAGRAVTEGSDTGDNFSSNTTLVDELRPDVQNPIAEQLLRSLPFYDATLEQADPVTQRYIDSEEGIRAEAVRQTAAFYSEVGSRGFNRDGHVQGVQGEDGATLMNVESASSSTVSAPNPPATATEATATAAPSSLDADGFDNEELYTDAN